MSRSPGWNPLIGIGFTALGVGYLYEAFRDKDALAPTPALPNRSGTNGLAALGFAKDGAGVIVPGRSRSEDILLVKDGVKTIKFHPAGNIDNRVGYIVRQINKDARDPKTITEATRIVSRRCPDGKGGLKWCVPQKAWKKEIEALFWALTDPNSPYAVRYTRDPEKFDGFRSADLMRRIPAGDCDDMVIRLSGWLQAIGYPVKARVVAPAGAPNQWAHIYLLAGSVPGEGEPPEWIPLDPTEPHPPGWEVPKHLISTVKDFPV